MKKTFLALITLFCLANAGCNNQGSTIKHAPYEQNPAAPARNAEQILTEKDFDGFGLSTKNTNRKEDTFKIQIHPDGPVYTFRVASFTPDVPAHVDVYKNDDQTKPSQEFTIEPDTYVSDILPVFFNAADINFDGFTDIGVPAEGGAQWASYQYWIYDEQSGKFIPAPVTKDFRAISFGDLLLDTFHRQIIASGLIGAVGDYKNIYQYEEGRLQILEENSQQNTLIEDGKERTDNPTLRCHITTKKYIDSKPKTTTKVLNHSCRFGIYD